MTLEQPTLRQVCRSSGNLLSRLSQRAPPQLSAAAERSTQAVVRTKEKKRKKETDDEKTLMQSGHYFRSIFCSVQRTCSRYTSHPFIYMHMYLLENLNNDNKLNVLVYKSNVSFVFILLLGSYSWGTVNIKYPSTWNQRQIKLGRQVAAASGFPVHSSYLSSQSHSLNRLSSPTGDDWTPLNNLPCVSSEVFVVPAQSL